MLLQGVLLLSCLTLLSNGQIASTSCNSTGEVRLVGGNSTREGRVEVCLNNEWGTVCDDLWDTNDATVVCRQLGLLTNGAIAISRAYFGEGTGPIHLDDVQCTGSELSLSQCARQSITAQYCRHSEDASVICPSEGSACADGDIRLAGSSRENEGRVEICFNNQYGTVCDDGWDNIDASVVCGQLGFQREGAIGLSRAQLFGPGFGNIYFDDVDCTGSEANLTECGHRGVAVSNCNHNEDAGVICVSNTTVMVCNNTEVRLSDGRTPNEGRVEICYNDRWGTVCDDLWDERDAQVVCRQLGFPANGSSAFLGAAFGQGEGLIFLDNVQCTGAENSLDECQADSVGMHNCRHAEDAAVVCQSDDKICEEGQVRLVDGPEGRAYEGRLEICIQNTWGTVCEDRYNIEEATVVCRQLGFTNGVALPLPSAFFGEGVGTIWLDELGCTGSEDNLLNCTHSGVGRTNCRHSKDVSIICPLPEGVPRNCTNGDIQLMGGEASNEGRVELCFNGRWGTVCDDNWDQRDAAVVCRQLGFSSALTNNSLAAIRALFGPGEGPILLDDVGCQGNENSLLACTANQLGTNNCNHGEDAGVLCPVEETNRQCADGEVRLEGGARKGEGRVEMCFNGKWGSVCAFGFDESEAQVTCRNLGFDTETTRGIPIASDSFGPAESPIILNGLSCGGSEKTFLQCPHTTVALQGSCTFGGIAAVICTEIPCTDGTIRLVGGVSEGSGRVEVCVGGRWGAVCADSVTDDTAAQICTTLGQQGTGSTRVPGAVFGPSSVPTYSVSTDTEGLRFTPQQSCGQGGSAGLFCLAKGQEQQCKPGDIRLAGGSGLFEGRMEVCLNNEWGTVCDDSWDDRATAVVCRQLGQPTEGAYAEREGKYGPGVGAIHLDDVKCRGTESHILECSQLPLSAVHNCDHTEDATVVCPEGPLTTTPPISTTKAEPSVSVSGFSGGTFVAIVAPLVAVIALLILIITIIVIIIIIVYKSHRSGKLSFRTSEDEDAIINSESFSLEDVPKEDNTPTN